MTRFVRSAVLSVSLPLSLLVLGACGKAPESATGSIVSIESGSLQGAARRDGILAFLGIPYAAPPTGDLRFRPPQPVEPWGGVRDARAFGPVCPQPARGTGIDAFLDQMVARSGLSWWRRQLVGAGAGLLSQPDESEDCLSLNVWTPELGGSRPVMVWIHGGGHQAGSGAQLPEAGAVYARRGLVSVTINYRLGPLGFLAHPALSAESPHGSSGNYGTLDQIAALEWVRDNVHHFGGDPSRVTIFGESAGGFSIGQLMSSPLARGLFHGAIAQSGIGTHQFLDLDEAVDGLPSAQQAGVDLLEAAGDGGAADAAGALRALSPERLRELLEARPELGYAMHPNVDGWVLPQSVARAFERGEQARVPLMLGFNADEGSLLLALTGAPFPNRGAPSSPDEWEAMLREELGSEAEAGLRHYPVRSPEDLLRQSEVLLGDVMFGQPALFAATAHVRSGAPAYLYLYSRTLASPDQTAGAFHGAELFKVFDTKLPMFPSDDTDAVLTRTMGDYWEAFARYYAPRAEGRPEWTAFDPGNPQWLELGDEIGMRPADRTERFAIIERQLMRPLIRR